MYVCKIQHQLIAQHVGTLNNKSVVQQVGVKFYICKVVAWQMCNIKLAVYFHVSLNWLKHVVCVILLVSLTKSRYMLVFSSVPP